MAVLQTTLKELIKKIPKQGDPKNNQSHLDGNNRRFSYSRKANEDDRENRVYQKLPAVQGWFDEFKQVDDLYVTRNNRSRCGECRIKNKPFF